MQDHEMRGLLGDAYDTTTPEQRAQIDQAATRIAERWPDPDLADTRQAALTGAMMLVLGDDTLEAVAGRVRAARYAYEDALAEMTGALLVSPGTEVELVQRTGLARMTVRKALGK